jgi:hypothetical protein
MLRDAASIKDDVREMKHPLTSLEGAVGRLKRDQAASYADTAGLHARYDRSAERLERVEHGRGLWDGDSGLPTPLSAKMGSRLANHDCAFCE